MKIKFIEEAKPFWDSGQPLKAGEIIYEHIRQIHRPVWAKEVLELCIPLTGKIKEVEEVLRIAKEPERWKEAHDAFSAVRKLTLKSERKVGDSIYARILYLAENVAKVIYNASGEPAPFDHDSGYWIVSNLRHIVDQNKDETFEKQAWHIVSCEKYSA